MTKITITLLITAIATTATLSTASAGRGGYDLMDRMNDAYELRRTEAEGGPWVEGSAYGNRARVCQILPTPVFDHSIGAYVKIDKKVCWWSR